MSLPLASTIKRLFAVSSNNCAFPRCPLPLVDEATGKVTGRIAHIRARSPGGPRFDANQTQEERNSFENLILLCPIHHDVIDADTEAYTVERLFNIKKEHENVKTESSVSKDIATELMLLSYNEMIGNRATSHNQTGGQTLIKLQISCLVLTWLRVSSAR